MKNYTDLEQSKKLTEILPIESADMHYIKHSLENYYSPIPFIGKYCKIQDDTPCWSLAALLDILPCNLKLVLAINDYQGERKERYAIGSVEHNKYDCYADNPIDACYKMILKLHELNLL